jgi:hypothetical protein
MIRTEAECARCKLAQDALAEGISEAMRLHERTQADQAVLDAMGAVPEDTLRRSLANTLHTDEHSRAPARAELARRGLK